MSDTQGWYARKLAAVRNAPARQQPAQAQPWPQHPQQLDMFNQPVRQQQAPPVNIENLWGAMQQWRGGKAHKIDAEPCPECGSNNYYSRTGEGARRGPPPAPHCFACGYNGMFTQGLQSTWQGGG